ncbi:metallophosphoesterase [Actinomadura rupiterrae]|uniref:metallophosphoesterase n=1 Tax=Actinomadura rupiterrae TaxID=559627 RepID=UPI0027E28EEF|nr:metallophosphoesterase [Actinomadura rupiterrae]
MIAHVSDVHVDGTQRSAERTRAVMAYLDGLNADLDAVLVTGDIADHGRPEEYELARELLFASRHPVMVCPGNHDERAAFREFLLREPPSKEPSLKDLSSKEPVNHVRDVGGAVIALCDSSIPGADDGVLEDETLDWLSQVLKETPETAPVLVGFHHPPTLLHEPFIDGIRQFRTKRLAEIADSHNNVVGFLCGHAHTAAATTFAGRPLLVAPGVVSTLRLPWEQRAHPEDYVHLDQPPAIAFHVLDDTGRITTHYRSVLV